MTDEPCVAGAPRCEHAPAGAAGAPGRVGRRSALELPWRLWKYGSAVADGPVHVSMNDYLIHRVRDVPRVGIQGLRLRGGWPRTPGALGLWVASSSGGRRQVSVSIWLSPEDLRQFVRSPAHLRTMRDFRDAGALYTSAWKAERFERVEIWRQATERLMGLVPGVAHH